MKKPKHAVRRIPRFKSETEEQEFWATHDTTDYFDWSKARRVLFPNLKPSTTAISMRLPETLLTDLRRLANERDVPYQSLMKVYLARLVAALAVPTSPAAAQRGQATLVTTPVLARQRVEGGVTILEHDRDAFTRATRLSLDASVVTVVGGAGGDPAYDLTGAHQVVLLSDGRLATFATVGNKFLIFGADGRGQRTLGRTGQGPGEFMAVGNMIGLTGDTLFLPDPGNNRLNWVRGDRGVVASRPRDGGSRSHFERAAGALPGGRLVMHSSGFLQNEMRDGVNRPPASVVVLPPSGPAREIAKIPDLELAMVETRYRGRPRIVATPLRFSRSAHVVVWDTLIATAIGDGYRVDLWTAEGRIVSRLAVSAPRRPAARS